MAVSGRLLRVKWSTGEESSLITGSRITRHHRQDPQGIEREGPGTIESRQGHHRSGEVEEVHQEDGPVASSARYRTVPDAGRRGRLALTKPW